MLKLLATVTSAVSLLGAMSSSAAEALSPRPREQIQLFGSDEPTIALQVQRPASNPTRADVVYVHGSSFGADLSIYFSLDGRSWADELAQAGFSVWGFDFVGYGGSARYPAGPGRPPGDIDDAMRDLLRVVQAVRQRNGNKPVVLLAHSRGGAVAARYASEHPHDVVSLVLFAPVVTRPGVGAQASQPSAVASHFPLSVWAQYRRFVQDVPRDEEQVLSEAHMQAWGEAWLASDPSSATRMPPSVMTPAGPLIDAEKLWSGHVLYDATKITAPTMLVRGAWDSVCNDTDAHRLLAGLTAARIKEDVKVPRATHLMHLEQQRTELHAQVNRFLLQVFP